MGIESRKVSTWFIKGLHVLKKRSEKLRLAEDEPGIKIATVSLYGIRVGGGSEYGTRPQNSATKKNVYLEW